MTRSMAKHSPPKGCASSTSPRAGAPLCAPRTEGFHAQCTMLSPMHHSLSVHALAAGLGRCGPCQKIKPIYEQFAEDFPDVTFLKVDVDECAEIAAAAEVPPSSSLPFPRFLQRPRASSALLHAPRPSFLAPRVFRAPLPLARPSTWCRCAPCQLSTSCGTASWRVPRARASWWAPTRPSCSPTSSTGAHEPSAGCDAGHEHMCEGGATFTAATLAACLVVRIVECAVKRRELNVFSSLSELSPYQMR